MKSHIHLTCFALTLAVIFCGSTIWYASKEAQYSRYIRVQNQKNVSQLLDSVSAMETALEKSSYVPNGAMRQLLAAEIWKESQSATASLASLPQSGEPLEAIGTYLSQAGDYAYYLLRMGAYAKNKPEEWGTLCALCSQSQQLTKELGLLKEQLDIGTASFRQIGAAEQNTDSYTEKMQQSNKGMSEYASLIYDGPYSDHVSQRKPLGLEGLAEITPEDGQKRASALFGTETAEFFCEADGQIPAYNYTSGTCTVSLTRQGGLLLSLSDEREIGQRSISEEDAVQAAVNYCKSIHLPEMSVSYYTVYETIVTVNLACKENDIIAYPDLVKVGIALDDGSVVRFDGLGYLMNHHVRTLASPAISSEMAQENIPANLTVTDVSLAYIPTSGYRETLCWELVCETEEKRHLLLYIDCSDGQAADMLLLIEDENGTLTR